VDKLKKPLRNIGRVAVNLLDAIECTRLNEEHDISIISFLDDAFSGWNLLLEEGAQNHLEVILAQRIEQEALGQDVVDTRLLIRSLLIDWWFEGLKQLQDNCTTI